MTVELARSPVASSSAALMQRLASAATIRAHEAFLENVPHSPMEPIVVRDPDILGGTPVFAGSRVPVKNLIDYLAAGDDLDEFLADFPTVRREQVETFLERATDALLAAETA